MESTLVTMATAVHLEKLLLTFMVHYGRHEHVCKVCKAEEIDSVTSLEDFTYIPNESLHNSQHLHTNIWAQMRIGSYLHYFY